MRCSSSVSSDQALFTLTSYFTQVTHAISRQRKTNLRKRDAQRRFSHLFDSRFYQCSALQNWRISKSEFFLLWKGIVPLRSESLCAVSSAIAGHSLKHDLLRFKEKKSAVCFPPPENPVVENTNIKRYATSCRLDDVSTTENANC